MRKLIVFRIYQDLEDLKMELTRGRIFIFLQILIALTLLESGCINQGTKVDTSGQQAEDTSEFKGTPTKADIKIIEPSEDSSGSDLNGKNLIDGPIQIDSSTAEDLINAMRNYNNRDDSINALVQMGDPAVDPLIKALKSDNKYIRHGAIEALGKIKNKKAVKHLRQFHTREDRLKASMAIAEIYDYDVNVLLPYLKDKTTVSIYYPLLEIGDPATERDLRTALIRFGDREMALDYLNCGNPYLEKAGEDWARDHDYKVISQYQVAENVKWGSGIK